MRTYHKNARKPRYLVTVWEWSTAEHCYTASVQYVAGRSLHAARRRASIEASALPSVTTTWALRSYARGGWASVTIEGHAQRSVYSRGATAHYVESIGERGY